MAKGPTLPESEYDRRINNIRESMVEKEYELLIVYSDEYRPGDGSYLSNYKPINVLEEAHQLIIVPIDDDPVLLVGTLNSYGAEERAWIDDVRHFDTLVDTLKDVVGRSEGVSKVGLAGEKILPVRYYNQIDGALADQEIIHDNELLARLRQYKSEPEIRMLERSAHIGEQSIVDVVNDMEVGDSEADLAAAGEYGARQRSAEIGSAYVIIAGDNTRHPTWRPSPDHYVGEDNYVIIDASPQYRGYAADVAITAIAGKEKQKIETLTRANELTNDFIQEEMHPGISASTLYDRMLEQTEREGWRNEFEPWAQGVRAIGHGVGIDVVEWPNLGPDTDVDLEPGMVVSIKFDLHGIPGGGLRVERMVHIEENSVRCLNFTDFDEFPANIQRFL